MKEFGSSIQQGWVLLLTLLDDRRKSRRGRAAPVARGRGRGLAHRRGRRRAFIRGLGGAVARRPASGAVPGTGGSATSGVRRRSEAATILVAPMDGVDFLDHDEPVSQGDRRQFGGAAHLVQFGGDAGVVHRFVGAGPQIERVKSAVASEAARILTRLFPNSTEPIRRSPSSVSFRARSAPSSR